MGELSIEQAPGQTFKQYRITPAGHERAQAVAQQVDPAVREYAHELVKWCQGLTFTQLGFLDLP